LFLDAVNRVHCEDGFHGCWVSDCVRFNYPALAATSPGKINPHSLYISQNILAALENETYDPEVFLFEKGIPRIFQPHDTPPQKKHLTVKPIPILDWKACYQEARSTAELKRKDKGTVFSGWDEFSQFLANPDHDLVTHLFENHTGKMKSILIGYFDPETNQAGKPIVIYIEKHSSDEGHPDRGCFSIPSAGIDLKINGSIVSEVGLDLRDIDLTTPNSGRWRDFTTGRDGRVVKFCGGLPLIKAENPTSCEKFGVYQWCKDGAEALSVMSYPGLPAIATRGDLWIIDRQFTTEIMGGVYAPFGHLLIYSQTNTHALSIAGYLYAKDIEICGQFKLADDPEFENSGWFRKEQPWSVELK